MVALRDMRIPSMTRQAPSDIPPGKVVVQALPELPHEVTSLKCGSYFGVDRVLMRRCLCAHLHQSRQTMLVVRASNQGGFSVPSWNSHAQGSSEAAAVPACCQCTIHGGSLL